MPLTRSHAVGPTKRRRTPPGQAAIDKALALTTENTEEFEVTYSAYYDQFQPQGELESQLVTEIVTAIWRMRRMMSAETEAFNAHLTAGRTLGYAIQTPAVRAIGRYEQRCSNEMFRAMAALDKLKAARRNKSHPHQEEKP